MTRSGCEYEGAATVGVGQVPFVVASDTPRPVEFDLWMIDADHTYEDFVAHIDEERRRAKQGLPGLGHPTFATLVAEARAEAGEETMLMTDVDPGLYAMACIPVDPELDAPMSILAAGPFEGGER